MSQNSPKSLRKNPVIIKEKDGLTPAWTCISLYKVAEKSVHFYGPRVPNKTQAASSGEVKIWMKSYLSSKEFSVRK